jgi:hypothetical protein
MARKKQLKDTTQITSVDTGNAGGDQTVLVFRATRPLMDAEHASVLKRLRAEEERTGVKVILVPYSVEMKEDGKK